MDDLSKCTILVVDDTEANIDILVEALGDQYDLLVALDAKTALEIVDEEPPDLILLDIMMPEMDGYEACAILKNNPETMDIPIVFLTAMTGIENKTKGFELGAVDYITKPFEIREVEARVKTHLTLKKTQEDKAKQFEELQQTYDDLSQAEDSRDALMHMIVHDMRTPLTGIKGSLDVFDLMNKEKLTEKEMKLIHTAQNSSKKLIEMVSSLLDLNKLEAGEMPIDKEEIDLKTVVNDAIDFIGEPINRVNFIYDPQSDPVMGFFDSNLVTRIMVNLLGNSIKFTPPGGNLELSFGNTADYLQVNLADTGQGIPEEFREKIFEKFGQANLKKEQKSYSTGIGLAFCKLAVEAHGGKIWVESEVGKGSTFIFTLPKV